MHRRANRFCSFTALVLSLVCSQWSFAEPDRFGIEDSLYGGKERVSVEIHASCKDTSDFCMVASLLAFHGKKPRNYTQLRATFPALFDENTDYPSLLTIISQQWRVKIPFAQLQGLDSTLFEHSALDTTSSWLNEHLKTDYHTVSADLGKLIESLASGSPTLLVVSSLDENQFTKLADYKASLLFSVIKRNGYNPIKLPQGKLELVLTTGFDREKGQIELQDKTGARLLKDYETLKRKWYWKGVEEGTAIMRRLFDPVQNL